MKILAEYRLRPAPRFVGREDELEFMERFYKSDDKRILSVVGMGGSGKTAVVSEFLKRCQRNVDPVESDTVFVWSFRSNKSVEDCFWRACNALAFTRSV